MNTESLSDLYERLGGAIAAKSRAENLITVLEKEIAEMLKEEG